MTRQEALVKIKELVAKYKKVEQARATKKYTEEETKKDFILPMFQALGWDIFDKNEVSAEESQSGGRVDYGFYLNEMLKFYLEAKSLKTDLNRVDYANQAIKYSWNKGATWAILTDFESLKVFNAQVIDRKLGDKLYFEIPVTQYVERFDQLWQLSKEAFSKNLIDIGAEKIGKKLQRVPVQTSLYQDLSRCRDLLTDQLAKMNQEVDSELLDEGVQRLLDRLIFIRVAEDRGIEHLTLIPLIRAWESSKKPNEVPLYKSMVSKFRELDSIYNSNLFTPHPLEDWHDWNNATEKIVKILQGKPGYYEYDFKVIPSDVLGSVYENYLGYRLLKSKNGLTLSKDAKKRKEHGIFYTPNYIVDYIVKNTLQPVLDKCTSLDQLKKIKILDPACGSGSFLIKALDLLSKKYKELDRKGWSHTKMSILVNNIYGVDLDYQAVELTKLNLLLNVLNSRARMPSLENNIKNGNSLISGTDKELRKYFDKNFRDKKPFNWNEEFPEVFKQGGFDVVIGNPPWISNDNIDLDDKKYFQNNFKVAISRFDIATLFVEQGINLLKKEGDLGFVLPEHVWLGDYFIPFRSYLANYSQVIEILSAKEQHFEEVSNPSSILIAVKKQTTSPQEITVGSFEGITNIEKATTKVNIVERIIFDKNVRLLRSKLEQLGFPKLGDIALVTDGVQTANLLDILFTTTPKDNKRYTKALRSGKDIEGRYAPVRWSGWWILKPEETRNLKRPGFSYDSPKRMACFLAKEKIILRQTEPTIVATLDKSGFYFPNSIFQIATNGDNNLLRWVLGIINSKFFRFYYAKISQVEGTTKPQIYLNILKSIPVPKKVDKNLVSRVDRILSLNRELYQVVQNSDKWSKVCSKINKVNSSIDEYVNKLYSLTPQEIKLVTDNSLPENLMIKM